MTTPEQDNLLNRLIYESDIATYLHLIKLNNEETYKHCIEVGVLTYIYLHRVESKYTKYERNEIIKGALIHDIGKIYLPFGLMQSTKKLDDYEYLVIQEHSLLGYVSIKDTNLSDIVKKIVLKHHCLLDGKGYPLGEVIQEEEQYTWIVAILDKFSGMTSIRSFKEPMSNTEAFAEIVKMAKNDKVPYQNMMTLKEVVKEIQL